MMRLMWLLGPSDQNNLIICCSFNPNLWSQMLSRVYSSYYSLLCICVIIWVFIHFIAGAARGRSCNLGHIIPAEIKMLSEGRLERQNEQDEAG